MTVPTFPVSSSLSPLLFFGISRGGASDSINDNDDEATPPSPPVSPSTTTIPQDDDTTTTTTTATPTTVTATPATTTIQKTPASQRLTETLQKLKSNPKVTNAIERTGPAILMLAFLATLLNYTGDVGLIGLIIVLQVGMYTESTSVIRTGRKVNTTGSSSSGVLVETVERWWWFVTIFAGTTLRHIIRHDNSWMIQKMTNTAAMAWYDLGVFGMVAVGLVMGICRMATAEDAGVERFRMYLGDWAGSNFALIFLLGQSSFWIKTIQTYGLTWVLYPALLVVVNDTMAYIFGVLFGKHKLLPTLSPKKTVEGFVGAGVSTAAVSIPLFDLFVRRGWFQDAVTVATVSAEQQVNDLFKNASTNGGTVDSTSNSAKQLLNTILCQTTDTCTNTSKCRMTHALVLAMYASLIAPFGGFLASAVKRAHGAKDFGSLIPGHGGVIDRFDCQIVMAPFVFLYLRACT